MNQEEQIRRENKELRSVVEGYMEEIQRLKKVNEQHEAQIETLLKFNERLLVIIETELNNYNSKKSQRSLSLQPISQITEKDSQAVEAFGTLKASIMNNIKMGQFQLKQQEKGHKKTGNETDRIMLGQNMSDALSYQISRSDYQREYSEYNKKQKVKEVMALINAYKQEYGESIREYEEIGSKIKQETLIDNMKIQTMNTENNEFYGQKIIQLSKLKQQMRDRNPTKQLQKIIEGNKYSASTQNKLLKIINSIN